MARVLILAYSCEPGTSSEGAVGWHFASRIARRHSVTLVTRPKAKAAIEAEIAGDPLLDLRTVYHEMTGLRRLKYLGLPVSNLRYLAWNHRMSRLVEEMAPSFDVVHHTTWVRHWMPSAGGRSGSTPFVWGPVGAAERPPGSLVRSLSWRGIAAEAARALGRWLFAFDPLMRRTLRAVDHAAASSRDTERWARSRGFATSLVPSVGFDPSEFEIPKSDHVRYEFVSVGRLLDWKGFHLGIKAFSKLDPRFRYLIIGSGPAASRLKRLSQELGVADRTDFVGRLSRSEVLSAVARSGVLVHPSLHDSGGFVVVEAMALGVPAVTLDIGGPPFLAGAGGLAVAPEPTGDLIDRLAAAMSAVTADRKSYSKRALERAEDLTWERIVDEYDRIYASVLGSSDAPES